MTPQPRTALYEATLIGRLAAELTCTYPGEIDDWDDVGLVFTADGATVVVLTPAGRVFSLDAAAGEVALLADVP